MLGHYAGSPADRRDQQHVLPDAEDRAADPVGGHRAGRVSGSPQGSPADHPPAEAGGLGRHRRALLERARRVRRQARTGAVPAAALHEEGRAPPGRSSSTCCPRASRAAFEFRHASWFDDEVYGALSARGAALCLAEAEDLQTPVDGDGSPGATCACDDGIRRRGAAGLDRSPAREGGHLVRGVHLLQARGRGQRTASGGALRGALGEVPAPAADACAPQGQGRSCLRNFAHGHLLWLHSLHGARDLRRNHLVRVGLDSREALLRDASVGRGLVSSAARQVRHAGEAAVHLPARQRDRPARLDGEGVRVREGPVRHLHDGRAEGDGGEGDPDHRHRRVRSGGADRSRLLSTRPTTSAPRRAARRPTGCSPR